MQRIFFFLGELKFQLSQVPLLVTYVIITMIAVPMSFPPCMLVQGISLTSIGVEEWQKILSFFIQFEVSCLFLLILWLVWSIVKTIKSLKQMNSARE